MSNRSLARKNRNRYKAMRSPNYSPRYKVILGSIGCNEPTGNGRIYPDFDNVQRDTLIDGNWLHGSLKDGTRPSEIFGTCEHSRHVPITVEQKEPLLCYTKTPSCLESIGSDYDGSMDPNHAPIFHMPTQEEMDNVWEDGILTLGLDRITQDELDKACGDGTKLK